MRRKKEAERRRNIMQKCGIYSMALMLLIFLGSPVRALAAEASVTFGSEQYEKELKEEFPIGVYITGEAAVGRYYVEIQYDTSRMEYTGGGDSEQNGVVILEGTGRAETIKYMLTFRAVGGGEAGIRVGSAQIQGRNMETDFIVTDLGSAPIVISGEDETGIPFLSVQETDTETEGEAGEDSEENAPESDEESDENRNDSVAEPQEEEKIKGTPKEPEPETGDDRQEGDTDYGAVGADDTGFSHTVRRFSPFLIVLGVFLLCDIILILCVRIQNQKKIKRRIYEEQSEKWDFEFETILDEGAGTEEKKQENTNQF